MGEWDLEKLATEFGGEVSAENAGFDSADVHQLIGKDPRFKTGEEFLAVAERIRNTVEAKDKIVSKDSKTENPNFYLVVLFRTWQDRKQFTDRHGLEDNRYVAIERLVDAIKKKKV
jgi:hypothetical protein